MTEYFTAWALMVFKRLLFFSFLGLFTVSKLSAIGNSLSCFDLSLINSDIEEMPILPAQQNTPWCLLHSFAYLCAAKGLFLQDSNIKQDRYGRFIDSSSCKEVVVMDIMDDQSIQNNLCQVNSDVLCRLIGCLADQPIPQNKFHPSHPFSNFESFISEDYEIFSPLKALGQVFLTPIDLFIMCKFYPAMKDIFIKTSPVILFESKIIDIFRPIYSNLDELCRKQAPCTLQDFHAAIDNAFRKQRGSRFEFIPEAFKIMVKKLISKDRRDQRIIFIVNQENLHYYCMDLIFDENSPRFQLVDSIGRRREPLDIEQPELSCLLDGINDLLRSLRNS